MEYYEHAGGWWAFVVTPEKMQHVPLPGVDDLLESISIWFEWLESPSKLGPLSYGPLHRLHEVVMAPLRPYLPHGGKVVLAPFSWLHLVPLGAALDPSTKRYAADDYELAFAPSLAAMRVARDQSRQRYATDQQKAVHLLSVAYPDVQGSKYYLPNVLPEAEAVARHFAHVTPLHEGAATPDAVLSHARGQDVLHLGCHGLFDFEKPTESGLKLSGGWLTVQRIVTELHLDRTWLATVGVCLSGRVAVREGEEHVGLIQALMTAGARAVVASLWKVDDVSTRTLFEAFYTEVALDKSLAQALAKAGRLVREQPGWEHPYYWAAFRISGLAYSVEESEQRVGSATG